MTLMNMVPALHRRGAWQLCDLDHCPTPSLQEARSKRSCIPTETPASCLRAIKSEKTMDSGMPLCQSIIKFGKSITSD